MPDLLAHALVAYVACQVLRLRFDWLTPAYTTVAMAGAFVPDVAKANLLVPNFVVRRTFDVPFAWTGVHTTGGAVVAIFVGGTIVAPRERRRVLPLLALGAASHLVADAFLRTPSGQSYPLFWPLSSVLPSTPGLYLSTEPGPTVVAAALAVAVTLLAPRGGDG